MSWIDLFVKCVSCEGPFGKSLTSFPLCELCLSSLVHCPSLCASCGRVDCPGARSLTTQNACLWPWRTQEGVHSFSSLYLMVGNSYEVLRHWKKRSGILLDRQILKTTPALLQRWQEFNPELIIAIPQNRERSWKRRGSRTEKLARWIGQALGISTARYLTLKSSLEKQAQFDLRGRMLNRIQFEAQAEPLRRIQRVLLVDDFMTSGRTLRQASKVLFEGGVREIHCFCLGIRTQRTLEI